MTNLWKSAMIVVAVFLLSAVDCLSQTGKDNPLAREEAVVIQGKARFTVLTSRMIRMEWAEDGIFEDRASFGVVNRNLPVPEYTVRKGGRTLTLKTEDVTLVYKGQDKFNAENLSVTFTMNGEKCRWMPGMPSDGNLLGTMRTVDGLLNAQVLNKHGEPYDPGVISRDGWVVIDESDRHLFEKSEGSWTHWVATRPEGDRLDWYMMAYGHDYMAAVSDYIKIGGAIPMPPKYAFGYWWCRYWQYSDFEFINLANQIKSRNIPIDVMVVDMDWHETWGMKGTKDTPKDEYGQRIGWTGYTWQKELFPHPENFVDNLHLLDLKTSLNLHPASGIQPYEDVYDDFVKDYLSRTEDYDGPEGYVNGKGEKVSVPFRIDQKEWADAYFSSVLGPFEDMGIDFWWLDWQQWIHSKYTPGLSNTFWLNYTFFEDKVRRSSSQGKDADRPMIYHRWGGLGSHRYPLGFSGDCYDEWETLAYLPYFTATASNVGYGYWGHDIGGHLQLQEHYTDADNYTRWLQYGVFTPIYKTHTTKLRQQERYFWKFPEHYDAMVAAIRLRYTLTPYIYDLARETYETGISMCRPLYYYYPEEGKAYSWTEEYLFGDKILATVVAEPVDSITGLASRSMWFPDGNDWYDAATGDFHKGGSTKTLEYTINENPYYVKSGAIIPQASPLIRNLQDKNNEIWFWVAPGDGYSCVETHDDDGSTMAYADEYTTTFVEKTSDAVSSRMRVAPRKGSFKDMCPARRVRVVYEGVYAPLSVRVNGEEVPYERFAFEKASSDDLLCWGYDGTSLAMTVYVPSKDASEEIIVECTYPDADRSLLRGKKGLLGRMKAITPETKLVYTEFIDKRQMLPVPFLKVAQCASFITEDPAGAERYLREIDCRSMVDAFNGLVNIPREFVKKIREQAGVSAPGTEARWMFNSKSDDLSATYGDAQIEFRSPGVVLDKAESGEISFTGMAKDDYILFTKPLPPVKAGADVDFHVCIAQHEGSSPRFWSAEYFEDGQWKTFGEFTTLSDEKLRVSTFVEDFTLSRPVDTLKIRCRVLSDDSSVVNSFRKSRWITASVKVNDSEVPLTDSRKALLLGNSFTFYFGSFQMLQEIARSQGHDIVIRTNQEPGASLGQHLDFELSKDAIKEGGYDFAILQDNSIRHAAYHTRQDKTVLEDTRHLVEQIRKISPQCRILIENTWPYAKNNFMSYGDMTSFQDALLSGCSQIAKDVDCEVSPVLKAFEKARSEGVEVYYPDNHHQSQYGSYLKACVNYLMLYGKAFEGYVSDCGLSSKTTAHLREIAESVVF